MQGGQSLIGMMIGLMISTLTVAAMLATYKTLIDISNNASGSAQRDGQASSALLSAQIQLQQAGFGIDLGNESAGIGDLLAVSQQGRQAVWRFRQDAAGGDTVCAGLRIVPKSEGDPGGLFWLPPKACASAADAPTWSGSGADGAQALASGIVFFAPTDRAGNVLAEAGSAPLDGNARFVLGGGCSLPYAQQAGFSAVSQDLQLVDGGGTRLFDACLPNIVPAQIGAGSGGG